MGATAGATAASTEPQEPAFDRSIDSVSHEQIASYAARLQFVDDPMLSDEQPMLYRAGTAEATRRGPTARIEPERNATRLSEADLQRGRIVARIVSSGAYEPLGLAQGANYMWVERRGDAWRAVMIPAASGSRRKVLSMSMGDVRHEGDAPAARWFFFANVGMMPWPRCGRTACCQPCEPPGIGCPDIGRFRLTADGVLPAGPPDLGTTAPGGAAPPRRP